MSTHAIASDLVKVDAYENTAADCEEIPEITDEEFARAVRHRNGVPVRNQTSVIGARTEGRTAKKGRAT